ncbi:Polyketide synthase enoylreductase [Penicillium robsamsonii]|uniref:Polyketide synthase enoylreductase n=1 Tax=Penicillium robsamsonii TaxID=1792511 RepID=UPI0025480157|nr:Polyketide synthase enoylreductase [Penicillium robsamsonii]KAJ5823043.1 Polyketide synthase enoylreductase [Penicillium robsamsonii]
MKTYSSLDTRYYENKTISGILRASGGFTEYMITSYYALVHLPDNLAFVYISLLRQGREET